MRYDIVMVTYNSEKWLRGCVEALAALEYEKAQIHLVFADNASQDGTLPLLERLRAQHPEFGGFTIVRGAKNAGFGAACNAGAKAGTAPYLLFFNVDTRIMPGALREMDAAIAAHPAAGGWDMRHIPYLPVKYFHPLTFETNWLSGAAMVLPREVFWQAGGFDEAIFMYCEDVDLSWRIRNLGYALYHVPQAVFFHYEKEGDAQKDARAKRSIVQNNGYLRRKFGTRQDWRSYEKLVEELKARPDFAAALEGFGPEQVPPASRVVLKRGFVPCFNGLAYDAATYFAQQPGGPAQGAAPLISILVRTHARPQLLRQALQTIRTQTVRTGFEVVVVEDGGPSAQAVTDEFADLPLRYHATGRHVGRGAAGNLAAQMAQGRYFCFFDEDDWLLPDYIETWQRLLVQHPQALLFAAGSMMECGSYAQDGAWQAGHRRLCRLENGIDALTLGCRNPVPIQAVLFSRSLFERCGGIDEELDGLEDWDLWQRYYCEAGHFICCDNCTSVFKMPAGVVEHAVRNAAIASYTQRCVEKAALRPVQTTMGELMTHFAQVDERTMQRSRQAQAYYDTAKAISESASWRATRPLRMLGNGLARLGAALSGTKAALMPEGPDGLASLGEYIEFIDKARNSLSWKLTAILRRGGNKRGKGGGA